MPKVVNENERNLYRKAMLSAVVSLLKQKSLRKITVEDITKKVGISKGSFYFYYEAKEILFFETIKHFENNFIAELSRIQNMNIDPKEKILKVMKEMYLSDESILLYITPIDFEWLMRKLPVEYSESEQQKSQSNFTNLLSLFQINPQKLDINVISILLDTLSFVATNREKYSSSAQEEVLNMLMHNLADYLYTGYEILE